MGPIEQQVSSICCEHLSCTTLDRRENLVDRGADSLLAAELIARLELEFGLDDLVEEFFNTPTVAGLVEAIARRSSMPQPSGKG